MPDKLGRRRGAARAPAPPSRGRLDPRPRHDPRVDRRPRRAHARPGPPGRVRPPGAGPERSPPATSTRRRRCARSRSTRRSSRRSPSRSRRRTRASTWRWIRPAPRRSWARSAGQVEQATGMGVRPVLVCSSRIRRHLRRLVEQALPQLPVVSYNEIVPGIRVETTGVVSDMTTRPRPYRGKTLDEVLPQIRAELGDDAIILRRREGIVGGIGGFFGRRCVEVDAIASPVADGADRRAFPRAPCSTPTTPATTTADDDVENPVIRTMMDQAHPFAQALQAAELRVGDRRRRWRARRRRGGSTKSSRRSRFPPIAGDGDWEAAASAAVAAGLPSAVVESLVRDARRAMQPFAQDSSPLGLLERALARQIKVEHGWRTKRRTIALVGAAGAGKTLTAAKLCHAYAHRLDARRAHAQPRAARRRLPAGRADRAPRHRPAGRADARDGGPRRRPHVGREPDRGRHPAGLGDRPGRHRRPGGAARGRAPRRDAPGRPRMGRRPRDRRALRGDHRAPPGHPAHDHPPRRGQLGRAGGRASRSRSSARSRTSPTAAGRSAACARPTRPSWRASRCPVAELEAAA